MQALKFESAASDQRSSRSTTSAISYDDSGLSDFLIARGVMDLVLGNRLYWYLMVEVALEDRVMAKMYGRVVFKFMNKILEVCDLATCAYHNSDFLVSLRMVLNDVKRCVVKVLWLTFWQNVLASFGHQKIQDQRRSKSFVPSSWIPKTTFRRCKLYLFL